MELNALLDFAASARDQCTESLVDVARRVGAERGSDIRFVQTALGMRANKLHAAIEVLLRAKYCAEAAILALSLFECRLDILYISADEKKAREWLSHAKENHQPWPVRTKIDAVFGADKERREGQQHLFRTLSTFKHNNPMSGSLGFGFRYADSKVTISNHEPDDKITAEFSRFITHTSTLQLLEGTIRVVNALGRGVAPDPLLTARLNETSKRANDLICIIAPELDAAAAAETSWVTPSVLSENLANWGKVE